MAEETVAVPEVAQEEVAPGSAEEAAAEPAVEVKEEEAAAPASNNKRKFEDPDDDAEAQLKKRPSFAAGATEAAEVRSGRSRRPQATRPAAQGIVMADSSWYLLKLRSRLILA